MQTKSYNERLRFFRKNSDRTKGMALSVTYLPNKYCGVNDSAPKALFEIAPLIPGSDNYNWDQDAKIIINLSQKEIATFVCLATKKIKEASFYHTPQKGKQTNMYVSLVCKWDNSGKMVMFFDKNKEKKYSFSLDVSEIECLRIAFEEMFKLILDWKNQFA